jgi:hypothetical protein
MSRPLRPLAPHETLLLACATPLGAAETGSAVREIAARPDLDWPAVARLALRHGVALCIAAHLEALPEPIRPPAEVAAYFARAYAGNTLRNRVMFREAARLQRGLAAAGIECLILKGVALALTVYPDPALRNFADIDLLVRPQDYAAAGEVAVACGFRCEFPEPDPDCIHQPYVLYCQEDILTDLAPLEFDPELPPRKVADSRHRVVVELHRGLFHDANGVAYDLPCDSLWDRPQAGTFPDGVPFLHPSPEVMLFHLAAHAADHRFGRLMFFMDIAAVARQWEGEIDWNLVAALSAEYGMSHHVYRSLELAARAFGASVPPATLETLAAISAATLQNGAGREATPPPLSLAYVLRAPLQDPRAGFIQRVLMAQNRRQLLGSLRSTIAPTPLVMRRIYGVKHPLLLALLYLLRPFLLVGRVIGIPLRRLRPTRAQRRTVDSGDR